MVSVSVEPQHRLYRKVPSIFIFIFHDGSQQFTATSALALLGDTLPES